MNKKQVFRDVVKHTPRLVHSLFTWGKIRDLESIFLSTEEIAVGEQNSETKEKIVKKACEKHKKRVDGIKKQIERTIQESSCLHAVADKSYLRLDMAFCYFAYGYIPEEYVFYRLYEHEDESYRRQYITEITRLCCRYAMNDFTESTYSNKDAEYEKLKKFYKRDAVVIRSEYDRTRFLAFAEKHPRFIEKATASSMGKDVCLIDLQKDNMTSEMYFSKKLGGGGYVAARRGYPAE